MNTTDHDDPGPALAELTRWTGEETELWKKALEAGSPAAAAPRAWWTRIARPLPRPALAACLVIIAGAMLVGIFLPALGKARNFSRQLKDSTQVRGIGQAMSVWAQNNPGTFGSVLSGRDTDSPDRRIGMTDGNTTQQNEMLNFAEYGSRPALPAEPGSPASAAPSASLSPDRFVVRKATIDLETPDVRAAFAKAAHLVSDASGEFVQDSSLTGAGKDTQGSLTLRVAAVRLGAVLTSLRDLGLVKAENTTGEDVTSQAVDLDARIRNEQKVEQELLQLLEKRVDAPLKDILDLRSTLAQVRGGIEQLIGQRDKLSRLVSLASILVTIRAPQDAAKPPPSPEEPKISAYFHKTVATSWRNGLEFLADTLAGAIALVIGGLIWWLLLAAAVMAILRYRTRAIMRGA